eukprot:XP_003642703.2 scale keratin-like isoform X1 [Gallus gallus]
MAVTGPVQVQPGAADSGRAGADQPDLGIRECHLCPLAQRVMSRGPAGIKAGSAQSSPKHCPDHLLLGNRADLSHTKMSCYDLCPPKTSVAVPQPIAESCNELCARQCPDSTAFIQPPPVVVTFPGPILSSFPQQAVVGSSGAPAFGGSLGLGGLYGAGATQGSGGLCTFGRPYVSPACSPCPLPRYSRKFWNTCGPC